MRDLLKGAQLVLPNIETFEDQGDKYYEDVRYLQRHRLDTTILKLLGEVTFQSGASANDYVLYIDKPHISDNLGWLSDQIANGPTRFTCYVENGEFWENDDEIRDTFHPGSVVVLNSKFFTKVNNNAEAKKLLETELS